VSVESGEWWQLPATAVLEMQDDPNKLWLRKRDSHAILAKCEAAHIGETSCCRRAKTCAS